MDNFLNQNESMDEDSGTITGNERLTVDQAIANLQGEHLGLRVYAAWWLGRFRVSEPSVIERLIQSLEDEEDRTVAGGYPLRRNAARALGKLGDRRAVIPLIHCLQCSDFYVREAAALALEQLRDPLAIPALIELLTTPAIPTVASDSLPPQPYDAILEALGSLQAHDAVPFIHPFLSHQVERIRCSALRAMYQLADSAAAASMYGEQLIGMLSHPNLQLRRTVLADLGAIGYGAAAEAIAHTLAENSLKLISLKGLLEKELTGIHPSLLSPRAMQVMALMDDLL